MEQAITDFLLEFGFSKKDCTKVIDAFSLYSQFLGKWNRSINLISRRSPSLKHHFYDSLQYLRVLPREGRFLDIGSGAGFPGVPVKIVLPFIQMVLLESRRKRVNFLADLIKLLNLEDIEAVQERAENLHSAYLESFDVVLFRGVGKPEICIAMGEPFLKKGGILVLKQAVDFVFCEYPGKMIIEKEISIQGLKSELSKLMVFRKSFT